MSYFGTKFTNLVFKYSLYTTHRNFLSPSLKSLLANFGTFVLKDGTT